MKRTADKRTRYLVDTSAIRVALSDPTPDYCAYFREEIGNGLLKTSAYVRMEFIRRWVCDAIYAAHVVKHYGSVASAMQYLEQDYSQRKNKAALAMISFHIRRIGPLSDGSAAEEFGRIAIEYLSQFDSVFSSRTKNSCKCQLGVRVPKIDNNHLMRDLRQFYIDFQKPVTDCEVNAFLALILYAARIGTSSKR